MDQKKVVLITGSSGGIGTTLCELYARNDFHVVAVDFCEPSIRNDLVRFIKADIKDPRTPEKIMFSIKKIENKLDILINNAAYQLCKSIENTSIQEWNDVFATNITAPFLLIKEALPLLKETRGNIVNIVSVHSFASSDDIAAYAASKGALTALTRNAALEFAQYGVRVNAVAPGAVDTPMLREGLLRWADKSSTIDTLLNDIGKKHPLGRICTPAEVSDVVYFLSDNTRASFITGSVLNVDGGVLAKLATE